MDAMLNRIIECIGAKHGAKKELADHIGISQNVFTAWFAGKSESYTKYATQIADYYDVSLDWLSGKTDIKKSATYSDGKLPYNVTPYTPTGRIPILGRIPAGAPLLSNENIEGYYAIDIRDPENHFALWVLGDSMVNVGITSGDLAIIRMQPCADNGQIVACRLNDEEATLKRFKRSGDNVILMPENNHYEPIIVPCSEFENGNASIIGIAVKVIKNLL